MTIPLYFFIQYFNFSINSAKKANIFFGAEEAAPNYRELPFLLWWGSTVVTVNTLCSRKSM